jgi:hypothetical protein
MPKQRDLKARIRARQAKTSESYTIARMHILAEDQPQPKTTDPALIEAQTLLDLAFSREPRLRPNGIAYKPEDLRSEKLADARAEMAAQLSEVAAAVRWLRSHRRSATFNKDSTSYGFKHQAERWSKEHGGPPYISNGSLIAAALGLGMEIRHIRGTPNVELPLEERSLRGMPPRRFTPFYLWLMKFIREESPRGDVARDAQRDFEYLDTAINRGPGQLKFWDGRPSQLLRRTRGTAAERATVGLLRNYRRERAGSARTKKASADLTWKALAGQIGPYLAELAKAASKVKLS